MRFQAIKRIGQLRLPRTLLILLAVASGPMWFTFAVKAQCNYNCGAGAFTGCNSYFGDPACANNGGWCYVQQCGGTCQNSQGQQCSPGPNTPPGLYQRVVVF